MTNELKIISTEGSKLTNIREELVELIENGFSALPCFAKDKHPTYEWKHYQKKIPTQNGVDIFFKNRSDYDAVCIITGAVSGGFEVIDFDMGGELYLKWATKIKEKAPELFDQLLVESTQSGGIHVAYRHEGKTYGNTKLASRLIEDKKVCLIETRGEGGLILVAPSKGYKLIQGSYDKIATISEDERQLLIETAWDMNETGRDKAKEVERTNVGRAINAEDDYNERGDLDNHLINAGWKFDSESKGIKNFTRPGKESGVSATLRPNGVFYVFSSNAHPFDSEQSYSRFNALAILSFDGNRETCEDYLLSNNFGISTRDVNISSIMLSYGTVEENLDDAPRTGYGKPIPEKLLHVPGLIDDVMQFSLSQAPHPNKVLSFVGALSLMSFVCGRKVMGMNGIRPNLYLLGLGLSGCGKDYPRKVNVEILSTIGMGNSVGDVIGSAEGIEDALKTTPKLLIQTDEIDAMLNSMKNGTDPRFDLLMSNLLKTYTSSDSNVPCRLLAGQEERTMINQPHLTIFGTAIPKNYYDSLSSKMLSNGFFGRTLVFESYKKTKLNACRRVDVPQSIIDKCLYWVEFGRKKNNLLEINPDPAYIEMTDEAKEKLKIFENYRDIMYGKAEDAQDNASCTVWARAYENVLKLSLIYTCSDYDNPDIISKESVAWASEIVKYLIESMILGIENTSFETVVNQQCSRFLKFIKKTKCRYMTRTEIKRKMNITAKQMDEIVTELCQDGYIKVKTATQNSRGKPCLVYELIE